MDNIPKQFCSSLGKLKKLMFEKWLKMTFWVWQHYAKKTSLYSGESYTGNNLLSSAIFICLCSVKMNQAYWLFNCCSFQKEKWTIKVEFSLASAARLYHMLLTKCYCLNLSLSFDWQRYLSHEKKQYESD